MEINHTSRSVIRQETFTIVVMLLRAKDQNNQTLALVDIYDVTVTGIYHQVAEELKCSPDDISVYSATIGFLTETTSPRMLLELEWEDEIVVHIFL